MKVLVMGHPRSGTGYAAKLFQSFGLQVGHERMEENGISSWFFGLKDTNPPYDAAPYDASFKPDLTINIVRKPLPTISSVAYTEFMTSLYRQTRLQYGHCNNQLESMISIDRYTDYVREHFDVNHIVKTEHLDAFCLEILKLEQKTILPGKAINSRPHPLIDERCIADNYIYQKLVEDYNNAW